MTPDPKASSNLQPIPRQALRDLIRSQLQALLEPVQPNDIADVIEGLPEVLQAIAFRLLPKDKAIQVYEHLQDHVQQALIEEFKRQDVLEIIDKMSPNDRARLLDELPVKVVRMLAPSPRQL